MATETITLRLVAQDLMSGNVSKAISGLDKLAQRGGLVGSVMQGVGQSFGQMLNPAALVAKGIGMVTDVIGDGIKAASDQAEAMSKVNVVFGAQARAIQSWARTAATNMGMSETAALSAAGTLGNLFDALGLTDDATRDMSKSIVQLAADLGSFNNVSTDEALTALRAGLLGETEPMRRFGSNLSAARVQAYALANGMAASAGAITDSIKVQARYALMLEDTKNAQGDFARTSEGLANKTKTLDAKMADLSVQIGKLVAGPASDFVGFLTNVVDFLDGPDGAPERIKAFTDAIVAQRKALEDSVPAQDDFLSWLDQGPAKSKALRDAMEFLGPMAKQIGLTAEELEAFIIPLGNAGLSLDEMRQHLQLLKESFADAHQPASSFMGMLGQVADSATETGSKIKKSLAPSVYAAFRDSLTTMAQMMDPWKAAWKQTKEYALDPFKPAQFERRLARFADRATKKAIEAANENRPAAARAYRRFAKAATDPVIIAMNTMGVEVWDAIAVLTRIRRAARATRSVVGNLFDFGGQDPNIDRKPGGIDLNAAGTSSYRGGWSWVGEKGPELMRLPAGTAIKSNQQSMAMTGGGVTVNVYAHASNNPAEVGREVTKALRAYRDAGGAPALKSAMGF